MNISFDLYRIFYYVCKNRSITKAANELLVSQPAITRHIKNLEGLLGVTLIYKSSGGIELTDEGEALYQEIKSSVEALDCIEKKYHLKEKNYEYTIRVIANYSIIQSVLLDVIESFSKTHPNIRFEVDTKRYDIAFSKLRDGESDLVLLNYKKNMQEYSDIQVQSLGQVEDVFIVRGEDRSQYPDVLPLEDIASYPLICKEKNAVSSSLLSSYLEEKGKDFAPKYVINTDWLITEYVKRGLGIGLIPKDFASGFEIIPTNPELPRREICYAIRKNSVYYPILQDFLREIKNRLMK